MAALAALEEAVSLVDMSSPLWQVVYANQEWAKKTGIQPHGASPNPSAPPPAFWHL